MPTPLAEEFWPQPLRHCARPLVNATDEEVTIGEITSEPVDGHYGNRMLYTALVPLGEVDSVLRAVGGIGHGVRSAPRRPAFRMGGTYSPPFSIDGPVWFEAF
jgi:hypothetical protein